MSMFTSVMAKKVAKKTDSIIKQEQENMVINEFLKKSKPKQTGLKNT